MMCRLKIWQRKEVVKHAKNAKKLGEKEYDAIVDQVVKKYGSLENITAGDVIKAGKELKGQWSNIQKHAKMLSMSAGGAAKKSTLKKSGPKKSAPAKKATSTVKK